MWKFYRKVMFLLVGVGWVSVLIQVACSPLSRVASQEKSAQVLVSSSEKKCTADSTFSEAPSSRHPNRGVDLKTLGVTAELSFLENPVLSEESARVVLRLWSKVGQPGGWDTSSLELPSQSALLKVSLKPPSGTCAGCFVLVDLSSRREDELGFFYELMDVVFYEPGTWTFRIFLVDSQTKKVIDEVYDQIVI